MWTPVTERITGDSQGIHRGFTEDSQRIRSRCRMRGHSFWHGLPEPNSHLLMTVVDWRCVVGCGAGSTVCPV